MVDLTSIERRDGMWEWMDGGRGGASRDGGMSAFLEARGRQFGGPKRLK